MRLMYPVVITCCRTEDKRDEATLILALPFAPVPGIVLVGEIPGANADGFFCVPATRVYYHADAGVFEIESDYDYPHEPWPWGLNTPEDCGWKRADGCGAADRFDEARAYAAKVAAQGLDA